MVVEEIVEATLVWPRLQLWAFYGGMGEKGIMVGENDVDSLMFYTGFSSLIARPKEGPT